MVTIDYRVSRRLRQQVTGMAPLRGDLRSITTNCFYRLLFTILLGAWLFYAGWEFVYVCVCAVCAVGVSRPDNGPDGKMLPARSRWRRPPATTLPIVFFCFCLFCSSVLSDRCGYMEPCVLESLDAVWLSCF